MSDYKIEIIPADKSLGETGFSGYCKKFHIITEGETLGDVMKNIFDNIPEVLSVQKDSTPNFEIEIKKPSISFDVPLAV